MKRNASVFIILFVTILAMLAAGKYLDRARKHGPVTLVGDVKGKPAPDFELTSLDGHKIRLSDYRGKAVLLNFWATWCSPCKVEMPWFVELQKQYGNDGLVILGVAMDDTEAQKIAQFVGEMGVNYPVLLGTDQVSEAYGNVDYLPTSFYIDRDGKIVGKGTGLLDRKSIEDSVRLALAPRVTGITASHKAPAVDPKAAVR